MNKASPMLTISMLISGRDEMKKSLESLLYFKESISCEIVLVDTGCNARQRALAESYADKVINFEWCDDFSAARNVGLKAARGSWFLSLDDDEWFEYPEQIINFFKSGDYLNYNSGTYVVRNYLDPQGEHFADARVSRMIKIESDTQYMGKIHEFLYPFKTPTKIFTDYVHHYGYAFSDATERRAHAKRNIRLLLDMIEAEPNEMRWVCQLAQEYYGIEEYEKTIQLCEGMLNKQTQNQQIQQYRHKGAVYAYLFAALEAQGKDTEEEHWLEIALAENEMPESTRAYFFSTGTRLYNKKKDYEQSFKFFKDYIDLQKKLADDLDAVVSQTALITAQVFSKSCAFQMLLLGTEDAIRLNDFTLAKKIFETIEWDKGILPSVSENEEKIVDACCSVNYNLGSSEILQRFMIENQIATDAILHYIERKYKEEDNVQKLERLYYLTSKIDYEDFFVINAKILAAGTGGNAEADMQKKQAVLQLYTDLFEKFPQKILEVKPEVWGFAEKSEISMAQMFLKLNYQTWVRTLNQWIYEASSESLEQWEERLLSWSGKADAKYKVFEIKRVEWCLLHYADSRLTMPQLEHLLFDYADKVLQLYRPYYKQEVFETMVEILPEEIQLALQMKCLQQAKQQKDDLQMVQCMRECVDIETMFQEAVVEYARELRNEIQNRNSISDAEQGEMLQILASLKSIARNKIQDGEYAQAREILDQILKIIPEDKETIEILQTLQRGEGT